jgi:hypothetical protein
MNIMYLQYAPWRGSKQGEGWMDSPVDGVGNGTLMGGAAAGWNSHVADPSDCEVTVSSRG